MRTLFWVTMALVLIVSSAFGHDDETRSQSGLPTFIDRRPGPDSVLGADATLTGTLTIQGFTEGAELPTFTVALLTKGSLVARLRVQNNRGFVFNGVPRQNVCLILEANGLEIGNYQIGVMNPPPSVNRQDIVVTWAQVGNAIFRRKRLA